jgi:hypothetical protein
MKRSSKLDSEPSKNPNALIFSYNLIYFISPIGDKAPKLIFPINTSKDILHFEVWKNLHKYFL